MMRPMRNAWRLVAVMAAATLAAATACAPVANKTATATPDKCTKDMLGTLYQGIFTFGTDQPVWNPWIEFKAWTSVARVTLVPAFFNAATKTIAEVQECCV